MEGNSPLKGLEGTERAPGFEQQVVQCSESNAGERQGKGGGDSRAKQRQGVYSEGSGEPWRLR